MKTTTRVAFLALVLGAAVGCSKDKPKAQPTVPTETPAAAGEQTPAPAVTEDQQVSPNLAVSSDIAAQCGLKAAQSSDPKFDYDKDELTPEDRAVLDQIATCLTTGALKGRAVSLIGRADPRGTEEYNLGLGSRRASTVGSYLGRLGVGKPQMAVTTRGALDASGTDESGWQEDRRVDIQLQPQG